MRKRKILPKKGKRNTVEIQSPNHERDENKHSESACTHTVMTEEKNTISGFRIKGSPCQKPFTLGTIIDSFHDEDEEERMGDKTL